MNEQQFPGKRVAKAKSRRTEMSYDPITRRYWAKLGRKKTKAGGFDGHKFRFTGNEKESERRKIRIQELWDRLVGKDGPDHVWDEEDLIVAKAISKGENSVTFSAERLAPLEDVKHQPLRFRSQARLYAAELARLQESYPEITIAAEDQDLAEEGRRALGISAERVIGIERDLVRHIIAPAVSADSQPTVTQALDAYEAHINAEFLVTPDPEEGLDGKRLSDTGKSYLDQIDQVRVQNAEQLAWPISRLTFEGCDEMLRVWRQRPPRNDGIGPMTIKTCHEHAKLVKRFFKWLSKSSKFDWKKPAEFDELSVAISKTSKEKSAPVTQRSRQVATYTVEELTTLNQYAIPFERFLLVCGLNLGFKRMECATLRVGEIHLRTMHEFAKYIDFEFSSNDSFVRRLRTKSEVYGEWILWPLTVAAMEWVLTRRRRQTHITGGDGNGREIPYSSTALVLLNDNGHSFTKQTKGGNPNHQITAAWTRLLDRVKAENTDFPRLPHESLRDTSSNWIREKFGGEIADIFLSHGSPLGAKSLVECYTNKPWGNVFKALRWLEAKLQPVFDSSPKNPFPDERKKRIGGLSVRQQTTIRDLLRKNVAVQEIAKEAGCSRMSVYRFKAQNSDEIISKSKEVEVP